LVPEVGGGGEVREIEFGGLKNGMGFWRVEGVSRRLLI
jgi:hypothetical protein